MAQLLVRRGGDPLGNLTQRERDVLAMMAEGRSNAEISASLVITDSAVSKHINSIFAKLEPVPGRRGPPAGARGAPLPRRGPGRPGLAWGGAFGSKTSLQDTTWDAML